MSLNELMCKNVSELSEAEVNFLNLHNDILSCGSLISNALVNLAINLKKMKDEEMLLDNMSDVNINLFCSKSIKQRAFYKFIYSYVAEEKYNRMFKR